MRWRSIGQTSFGTDLNEDKSKSLEGTGSKRKRHSGIQISFITQICGGETFCIAMNDTNQLIGWGSAFYGELGAEDGIQGSTMNEEYQVICAKPHVLFPSSLLRWQRVACGWHHSGFLYAWGSNTYGQVGPFPPDPKSNSKLPNCVFTPNLVALPVAVIQVSAGFGHSMLLDQSHRLWTWGRNWYGELGLGEAFRDIKSVQTPQLVERTESQPIQLIAAGYAHSAAISLEFGQLYTFGWGLYHQLGHGTTENRHELTRIEAFDGIFDHQGSPLRIKTVACGMWHTAACTSSGDLYTWGWNQDGQLGHEAKASKLSPCVVSSQNPATQESLENVKDVVCGGRHTTALCKDGQVFHWGLQPSSNVKGVRAIASGHSNAYILPINKN
ncbi:unnamed protein product [Albugo candida]|nr:unnamed protein product [Albugo candida]|eukprot:CCI43295.1 unnamed protein product [Albugo candida]